MFSCKVLVVVALTLGAWAGSFSPAWAQIITAPQIAPWPLEPGATDFGLMKVVDIPPLDNPPFHSPRQIDITMQFDPQTRVLVPARKVRIGPIKLLYERVSELGVANFTVTVFGRSP